MKFININFNWLVCLISLLYLNCNKENDNQLLKIVDSFQTLFNENELLDIKNLNQDSLYSSNFKTYVKYLVLFDENNINLEINEYFNSHKIVNGMGFKWDFLIIALHLKLNDKKQLINFSYLRENVLYRSNLFNKARFKKSD